MSNWGIGLLFGFGPGARPEVMAIRDVEAHCPACGRENIVRRYEALPFHSLTVVKLRHALEARAADLSGKCAQCDADFGPGDAVRWVLHYGFPSGRGMIQGFADADGARRWLLSPHAAMDVQLVPAWDDAHDLSRREVEALTSASVVSTFGRAFNPKEEARIVLAYFTERGTLPLTDGLWLVLLEGDTTEQLAVDAVAEFARLDAFDHGLVAEPLVRDGVPRSGFAGAPAEWIGGVSVPETVAVWGVASCVTVAETARDIVAKFPIEVRFDGDELAGPLVLSGPAGMLDGEPPELDAAAVAREAARTLIDPGDAARLEIDRMLHGMTGLWDASEAAEGPEGPKETN